MLPYHASPVTIHGRRPHKSTSAIISRKSSFYSSLLHTPESLPEASSLHYRNKKRDDPYPIDGFVCPSRVLLAYQIIVSLLRKCLVYNSIINTYMATNTQYDLCFLQINPSRKFSRFKNDSLHRETYPHNFRKGCAMRISWISKKKKVYFFFVTFRSS